MPPTSFELPARLHGWITVTEVQDGAFYADHLFQRKYGGATPDYGRHIVALYRDDKFAVHTLSYLHFWQQDSIGLIGGGCTDGNVMRSMAAERSQAINEAGGMLRQTLLFAFTHLCEGIDAFFGHAGDTRAREVDLAAGFEPADNGYLLIKPVGELSLEKRAKLTAQAVALGEF